MLKYRAISSVILLSLWGCQAVGPRTSVPRRYLFVVPIKLPDGRASDSQVAELKSKLVEWAGGYTVLGRGEGGWWDGHQVVAEENLVFFVQGPPDIQPRIAAFIKERFAQQEAFVAAW